MKSILIFIGGVIVGLVLVAVWPLVVPTTTYTAKSDLVVATNASGDAEGRTFIVPAGTVFVYDTFFSEGFDSLKLYVNASNRDRFGVGKSEYDRIPCWLLDQPPAQPARPPGT